MRVRPNTNPIPEQLAVRLERDAHGNLDRLDLRTFNPDNDDEGRARDYGVTLLEGAFVVADMEDRDFMVVVSLLENAPRLHDLVQDMIKLVDGTVTADAEAFRRWRSRATRALEDIKDGRLVYDGR